jgi:hypothetical protein
MKRTVIWLTQEQIQALMKISKTSKAPVSAIVRHAVRKFLGTKTKHRKQKGRQRKKSR